MIVRGRYRHRRLTLVAGAVDTFRMGRRLAKPVAKARTPRVRYAALVAEVESSKRPRRVPGRMVAVVPLATLRRLRAPEREMEDREDRAAVDAVAARAAAYSSLEDVKRRLLG